MFHFKLAQNVIFADTDSISRQAFAIVRLQKCQILKLYICPLSYYSVKTDLSTEGAVSRLFIAFASKRDSGNYTCGMRNAQASVIVHILNGKWVTPLWPKRVGFLLEENDYKVRLPAVKIRARTPLMAEKGYFGSTRNEGIARYELLSCLRKGFVSLEMKMCTYVFRHLLLPEASQGQNKTVVEKSRVQLCCYVS